MGRRKVKIYSWLWRIFIIQAVFIINNKIVYLMRKIGLFYLFYFLKYLSLKLWPLIMHHPLIEYIHLLLTFHLWQRSSSKRASWAHSKRCATKWSRGSSPSCSHKCDASWSRRTSRSWSSRRKPSRLCSAMSRLLWACEIGAGWSCSTPWSTCWRRPRRLKRLDSEPLKRRDSERLGKRRRGWRMRSVPLWPSSWRRPIFCCLKRRTSCQRSWIICERFAHTSFLFLWIDVIVYFVDLLISTQYCAEIRLEKMAIYFYCRTILGSNKSKNSVFKKLTRKNLKYILER